MIFMDTCPFPQIAECDEMIEPGSPTDQDSIVLEPERRKKNCMC